MNTPFFSIIIPTYNRAHLIARTLSSVRDQLFSDYELIVVDDGSTDETEEVVRRLADAHLHYFKIPNAERGAARNFGIKQAKGKYITFCDSDDLLYPQYLANAFETITVNHEPEWMHLAYEIKRTVGAHIKIQLENKKFKQQLVRGNPLSCMGVFIKREIFDEYLFMENRYLAGSEDWELWLRLSARYPIVFDNRVSAALMVHDERSVVHTSELKLQLRKYLSIGYAFDDEYVKRYYGNYRGIMNACFDTYIALHLVLSGERGALKYMLRAFYRYPLILFSKRSWAIIKRLILNSITGQ